MVAQPSAGRGKNVGVGLEVAHNRDLRSTVDTRFMSYTVCFDFRNEEHAPWLSLTVRSSLARCRGVPGSDPPAIKCVRGTTTMGLEMHSLSLLHHHLRTHALSRI